MQFNKSVREKYPDEIIEKLFNWIGIFSEDEIPQVVADYKFLIQTKVNYKLQDRFDKIYSHKELKVKLRPLIFGIDRFNYKDNQIWHINGEIIIDFLWKCFREELECRNCQLRYDNNLCGEEFESIIRYFKDAPNKPKDFEGLYKVLAPTKCKFNSRNSAFVKLYTFTRKL